MDEIVIWETQPVPEIEFRLYYDEQGKVLFYTCEKPEGNYIVIDAQTYAETRPDIRVIDGQIVRNTTTTVFAKLVPSDEGQACLKEDMSIIADENYQGETIKWKYVIYEL